MADGKWIEGLTPDTPAVVAARRALELRLAIVTRYLPLAAARAHEDDEYVHQLRVATRRATSALKVFAEYLPGKRARRVKNQLRSIRQVASVARDWDVFQRTLARVARDRPADQQPAFDFLRGFAFQQRLEAQPGLSGIAAATFDADALVAAVGEATDGPRRLGDLAPLVIETLVHELSAALANPHPGGEELHRIRIIGKRLRYAMEIFADCFGPSFRRTLYPAVEEMQETLGDANDGHVAVLRLSSLRQTVQRARAVDWPRFQPGFDWLIDHFENSIPAARERFDRWRNRWSEWHAQFARVMSPIPEIA